MNDGAVANVSIAICRGAFVGRRHIRQRGRVRNRGGAVGRPAHKASVAAALHRPRIAEDREAVSREQRPGARVRVRLLCEARRELNNTSRRGSDTAPGLALRQGAVSGLQDDSFVR